MPPCPKTCRILAQVLADEGRQDLKRVLQRHFDTTPGVDAKVAGLFDFWTSAGKDQYGALMISLIDEDFNHHVYTLSMEDFLEGHPASETAQWIKDVIKDNFPEPSKGRPATPSVMVAITSDGGKDAVAACNHLGVTNVQCYPHRLSNVLAYACGFKTTEANSKNPDGRAVIELIRQV